MRVGNELYDKAVARGGSFFFLFFLPRDSWTLSGKKSFRNVDRFVERPRPSSSRCFCDWWGVYEWARGAPGLRNGVGCCADVHSRPAECTIPRDRNSFLSVLEHGGTDVNSYETVKWRLAV